MKAAFLAVGSELLGTERLDTNSLRVTRCFRRYGVELRRKAVVGDEPDELVGEVRSLLGRFDLVVISGGLGPTEDDRTREAVARACGLGSTEDPAIVADIRRKFAQFGRKMPEVNRRQAQVIEGATVLPNPRGTAPGLRLERGGTTFFLLPGPPRELEGLLEEQLEPWLETRSSDERWESLVLKVAGWGESAVEERIAPIYAELGADRVTVLASPGEVWIELWARGAEAERERELRKAASRVEGLLSDAVFARDERETLESVCGGLLGERGLTVATAESCTGGGIAERLTAVPGSSEYYLGSIVAYADEVKEKLVGVPTEILRRCGAVSEEVALALAEGARSRVGSDLGIGVTGIAGPGGGVEGKPVGTVHVAITGPGDTDPIHRRARFAGSREMIRRMTGQLALEMLRRRLLDPSYRPESE